MSKPQKQADRGSAVSPFDHVRETEEREKRRREEAKDRLEKRTLDALRAIEDKLQKEEESLRQKAEAEVEECAKTEVPAILAGAKSQANEEVKKIEQAYAKQSEQVVRSLLKNVSDPTFLLAS